MLAFAMALAWMPSHAETPTRLGEMKYEKKLANGLEFRLYIQGKATEVGMMTSEAKPELAISRLPSGAIYGTVSHTESGAYMMTNSIAFVQVGGKLWQRDQTEVAKRRGHRLLVVPVQRGPWAEKGSAFVFDNGSMAEVGFATQAFMKLDGSVAGWYYSLGDHSPFQGLVSDATSPVYKQFFEWRNGHRILKGRQPAS